MSSLAHEDAQDRQDFCSGTQVLITTQGPVQKASPGLSPDQGSFSTIHICSWMIHFGGELFVHCHMISTIPGPYPF